MRKIHFFTLCILAGLSMLLFSCNQKDLKPKPEEEMQQRIDKLNSDADKVEKATLAYATTDPDLGAYDSIKFVSIHPYTKMEYCQLMQQILTLQNETTNSEMEEALLAKDAEKLASIDQELTELKDAKEFYSREVYNMNVTKDNPTVLFEAKCYVYTDGYIEEPVYYLNSKFQIVDLDPYNFDFIK